MQPKVSICIPTYNGAPFLKECVEAVQNQTFYEFEIIIVDDQSKDDTFQIANELAEFDARIKVYRNEKNLGLVGNWNKCLEYTTTNWIKYVFQDDMILPDCLDTLYHQCLLNNKKVGICNRRYVIEANADSNVKNYILNDLVKLDHFCSKDYSFTSEEIANIMCEYPLVNIFGEPSSLLFHKDLITQLGSFNEDISQMVDYEFMAKICLNEGCYFSHKPLNFFRIHSENQTNKNRGENRENTKMLKIEYVDAILLLHNFLYNPEFKELVSKSENKDTLQEKYTAEILKGIDQLGLEKFNSIIDSYFDSYPHLKEDISQKALAFQS